MPNKPRQPLPPIPPESPLRSLFPDEPLGYVPVNAAGAILIFTRGLYGSLALSLPILGAILVSIVLSINPTLHLPSPYGDNPAWMIGLCLALLIAHIVHFSMVARRVRRNPADPEPLIRALRRAPWLLWLYALILLAQYPWQKGRAPVVTALIAAGLALLTHLAVWASLRKHNAATRILR